jgi:hypothetical protein
MVYNIDNLPAKIYFSILETDDYGLLSNQKGVDAEKLWQEIYGEVSQLLGSREGDKVFDLSKAIHHISTKIEVVSNSIFLLRRKRDEVIEGVIKGYNYTLRDGYFQSDLDQIEREIDNLEIKIARYKKQLDPLVNPKGGKNKKQSFEDIYFSYCTIWAPYKEVNTIFIKEFIALEKQVVIKIKNLEKNG